MSAAQRTAQPIDTPPSNSHDEVSIDIAASPKTVYELISDVTNMGKWSPETTKVTWLGGAHSPLVGARFRGWNKRGAMRWFTDCEIVAADPARELSFVVGLTSIRWSYVITETDGGCTLTERRTEDTPRRISKLTGRLMGKGRPQELREGMITTLERIKAAAER